MTNKSFLLGTVRAAILLGSVLAAYFLGLKGGFFFDDQANILDVPALRVESLSIESLLNAWRSGGAGPSGRPVAQISFALNYYFSGFDPFWFKVTNLIVHSCNGLLLLLLAQHWLRALCPTASHRGVTLASTLFALAWLLHPLQLTSVLYVVQRMTSLSALFLLLALWFHIRAREQGGRWQFLVAWCVFWPISILCKETGVLFPFFVAVWELTIRRGAVQRLDYFARGLAMFLVVALVFACSYPLFSWGQWITGGYEQRAYSLGERLLTEGRVLWLYLALVFAPRFDGFALFHDDIAISSGFFEPWTTALAWGGLAGVFLVGCWWRQRLPVVAFGIFWFLAGHGLESTILPLEIAHEHRNYLPLAGPLLVVVWGILLAYDRPGATRTLSVTLAMAMLGYLGLLTVMRSHQFGEPTRRTQFEVLHHPGSSKAQYEAGRIFANFPQAAQADSFVYFAARKHFDTATSLDPDFKLGLLGSIFVECQATGKNSKEYVQELTRRLREGSFGPGDATVLQSVKDMALAGTSCLTPGQVEALFVAMINNPHATVYLKVLALSWLADYFLMAQRDMSAARRVIEQSLALAPDFSGTRLKWVQLSVLEGRFAEALKVLNGVDESLLSADERELRQQLLNTLVQSGAAP